MEVLGDALVREEQTAEIPIIDPKVLERAKSKYQKLDDELSVLAKKYLPERRNWQKQTQLENNKGPC